MVMVEFSGPPLVSNWIDQSLIEAAQVDGATKLQVFWKIDHAAGLL